VSEDRPVRLVLDASAILLFVRQRFDIGETLAEVSDNDAVAALPLACLVEAAQHAVDADRLNLIAEHPATVIVGADPADWQTLGELYKLTGGYPEASAALTAMDYGCWVLTARTSPYRHVAGGELAIAIED
jgi:hypothetical protein